MWDAAMDFVGTPVFAEQLPEATIQNHRSSRSRLDVGAQSPQHVLRSNSLETCIVRTRVVFCRFWTWVMRFVSPRSDKLTLKCTAALARRTDYLCLSQSPQ